MESITDFSDPWVCPNDRQLALRGRLDTGWSTFPDNVYKRSHIAAISDSEQDKIVKALCKAAELEDREQERIGYLVEKVSSLKASIIGDGEITCLVCGARKGTLKPCSVCARGVCSKCNMENVNCDGEKIIFCIICWEERELWKKSGAWFYKAMPHFLTGEQRISRENSLRHHPSVASSGSYPRGSLIPRTSIAPSIRRPSFFTEEDNDEELSDEESEDEFSNNLHSSLAQVGSKATSDFNLGIDVNETSRFEDISRHSSREDLQNFPAPPGISVTPDTPINAQAPFDDYFDQVDGGESTGSLSPQMRPRVSSNVSLSDTKKKLALKFRKKNKGRAESPSPSPSQSPRPDTVSQPREEDVDEIFKNYEAQNGDSKSKAKPEYFGPLGILEFTLQYDPTTLELLIIVNCGKGLKAMDHGKTSDPYVKTHLLPDASKSTKKRTQTVHRNLNPVFNETLIYHGVSEKDIGMKVLRLSVMDENKLSSNALIGETCVALKSLINRPVQQLKKLLDRQSELQMLEEPIGDSPGRIEIALHYLSKQQKLVVGIIRCAGLKAMDPNGYSDPYVKCYLNPGHHKKSKRKTTVKKKTLNPEFNEEFVYDIAHNELAKKSLLVAVWDHDVGTRNDFIGAVTLGIHASGEALKHWFETLKTSDRRVIRWHTLSPSLPTDMDDGD